jgi:hypothetical protein
MDPLIVLEPLSLGVLLLNLLLGIALSAPVAWAYARFGSALSNRGRFARLLPVLCLITVLLLSVVKISLALTLGLVGALSIVRFRTAIKDPEELIYLLVSIGIGIGLGADQQVATAVAVGALLSLLVVSRLLAHRRSRPNLYLTVRVPKEGTDGMVSAANGVLLAHGRFVDMKRLDHDDGLLQLAYCIDTTDGGKLVKLMDALKERIPNGFFSFVDQSDRPG